MTLAGHRRYEKWAESDESKIEKYIIYEVNRGRFRIFFFLIEYGTIDDATGGELKQHGIG